MSTHMGTILFSYDQMISLKKLQIISKQKHLFDVMHTFYDAWRKDYNTPYASLRLVFDQDMYQEIEDRVEEKKKLNPTVLIVVGIGGSALGAKAIHQAIRGRFYHANNPKLRVYFVQTIDSDRLATIITVIRQELQQGNAVVINVITKSGTTTETLVNFEVLLAVIKEYRVDYANLIVVTTDEDSPLALRAQKEQFTLLLIPKKVGGRYSVFSAVGIFPLLLAGINTRMLCAGARSMIEASYTDILEHNMPLMSALLLHEHYKSGCTINDMFIFSVDLEAVGKWYRQLMGESIGKEYNKYGQKVSVGITPTVSLGTIDLHSVAQLYLGGPRDKFTTFVTVEYPHESIAVPSQVENDLRNKPLSDIMKSFVQGTQKAYRKNGRPFCTVTLPEKNEWYLGQFLQYKMLEIMYLGYLLEVDPFDQPNVELYKQEVRLLLNGV